MTIAAPAGPTLGSETASSTEAVKPLAGKTAIITGARRSIGLAIADALAKHGAAVVVHYRSDPEQAEAAATAIAARGIDAIALEGDLTDSAAVAALFARTVDRFGGVDIVVANAGATSPLSPVAGISDETFDTLLATNTRGTFYVLREAARTVRDGGRIINISSSIAAFLATPAAGWINGQTILANNGAPV